MNRLGALFIVTLLGLAWALFALWAIILGAM
jgi:hypothetical protein